MLFFALIITAFLMEAVGSYVSVVGLSSLFGADLVIMSMAIILDVAKLVSVSFLYQYWRELGRLIKTYMVSAIVILMLITSSGAFGYLSAAFQKAVQPTKELSLKLDSTKREVTQLTTEKAGLLSSKESISKQIANLPPDYVNGRTRLLNSFKPEQERIDSRLAVVNQRLANAEALESKLGADTVQADVHVGPITYVAKTFDVSIEAASKYVTLMIIFVFDPLAIMLILSANFLVVRSRKLEAEELALEERMFDHDHKHVDVTAVKKASKPEPEAPKAELEQVEPTPALPLIDIKDELLKVYEALDNDKFDEARETIARLKVTRGYLPEIGEAENLLDRLEAIEKDKVPTELPSQLSGVDPLSLGSASIRFNDDGANNGEKYR